MLGDKNSDSKLSKHQIAQILKHLNVFKILPEGQKLSLKTQERTESEIGFLELLWSLMNPVASTRVKSRIVIDMLKLIYDPYIIGAYFSN